MTDQRPTMFVAEDSNIASLYEALFGKEYAVTVAQTGEEAFALAGESAGFDISLIDIIMPVENDDLSMDDTHTTGLRLIKYMIDHKRCDRFVVLTVRWDIEDKLTDIIAGRAHYDLLLKTQANEDMIRSSITKLMAKDKGE